MAKASKTFADKMQQKKKEAPTSKMVRIIRTVRDPDNGAIRFLDNMAAVSTAGDLDANLKKLVDKES